MEWGGGSRGNGRGESEEFKREQSRWVMARVVRSVARIFQSVNDPHLIA